MVTKHEPYVHLWNLRRVIVLNRFRMMEQTAKDLSLALLKSELLVVALEEQGVESGQLSEARRWVHMGSHGFTWVHMC